MTGKPRRPKKPPRPRVTQGTVALRDVLSVTTMAAIAARCRVDKSAVSLWASGHTRPAGDSLALLQSNYGIRAESWHTPYSAKTY
jgi:transcriptional regulator with XRE-family HTH domain